MRALLFPLLLMSSPPPSVVALDGHGFASASGTVQHNVQDCRRDAVCMLQLAPAQDGGAVHIIYHHGEGERRCASEALTRRAPIRTRPTRVRETRVVRFRAW